MSVTTTPARATPAIAFQPSTYAELVQFSQAAARSSMVPKDYLGKPENVIIAVQMGAELGLRPMQALQNISVINGRPSVWGDALLGLVRANPLCQDVHERIEGEGDAMRAICTVKRAGASDVERDFSVSDAKRAGLMGKPGPWQQYPKRMLQMRARGFAVRDAFPDVLRGLLTSEEASDIPPDTFSGPTLTAHAEPVAEPVRRTEKTWLAELEEQFIVARNRADVDEILGSVDVRKAVSTFQNVNKVRLDSLIATALAQHPGDAPDMTDASEDV